MLALNDWQASKDIQTSGNSLLLHLRRKLLYQRQEIKKKIHRQLVQTGVVPCKED